ncbi:MAG TPA: DEAD/DEAH box helicase, partial [Myxococcales bacterium]|nr:DEAD/DEAH box helicase [Myxococcales bacterium]
SRFVAALCAVPDLEERRELVEVSAPVEELQRLVASAPPMIGGEYLGVEVLGEAWSRLLGFVRAEIREAPGTFQELLARWNPAWNVVGRVHFSLAENRRNLERPFAFLASYTTGLSTAGKPQHRPLGDAVRESSSKRDKDRLLALLVPVQKAAARSAFVKDLVDSGRIFQPQAWTVRQAHRFLLETPAMEESGVVVRVPDWWKARRRPRVSVSVGAREPSMLGLDALLDFSVQLTLEGEEVTEAELKALRSTTEGLALLKGRWVEVDREKLDQVLAHWETVRAQAGEGVSFAEGMRLLAGAEIGGDAGLEEVREWSGVQAGPWLSETLAGLRDPGRAAVEPGPSLRAELRPYQREGLRWLWLLSRLGLGACLADDMGLGKTVQVLALLLLLKERGAARAPHLLVLPASLLANWRAELERFAPSLRLLVAHPSEIDSKELAALPGEAVDGADVVATSYGTLQRLPWMSERRWGLVVLDEAQAIKNAGTKQARAVKKLSCVGRMALTGTPVENRLTDLWSIFDFLNPGLLGSEKDFARFVRRTGSSRPLRDLTRPYILRRLKTDRSVIADLPEKTELRAFCALGKRQAALYQEAVESLARELREVEGIERRGLVLAYLMRFKQICNHPSHWLGDGRWAPEESGKVARLRELCEVVASRQEKALVFTQFREMTEPLAGWLARLFGRQGLVLSGQTPVKQRQELVRRFQEDEQVPFFVLSVKAGGTGLNLTAASHVIHFDRWWNPAVENQATDRAFRIGQKRNVLVHKLVCRGTVEERVDALIESKQGMARELLEGGEEIKLTELGDRELLELVSLDIHSARQES